MLNFSIPSRKLQYTICDIFDSIMFWMKKFTNHHKTFDYFLIVFNTSTRELNVNSIIFKKNLINTLKRNYSNEFRIYRRMCISIIFLKYFTTLGINMYRRTTCDSDTTSTSNVHTYYYYYYYYYY